MIFALADPPARPLCLGELSFSGDRRALAGSRQQKRAELQPLLRRVAMARAAPAQPMTLRKSADLCTIGSLAANPSSPNICPALFAKRNRQTVA